MNAPIPKPKSPRRIVHLTAWQVFRMPVLIALVSAAGLAFALFGDGIWDGLSWLALSIPVALSLIYGLRVPRAPR
jgi:hypothetical protein